MLLETLQEIFDIGDGRYQVDGHYERLSVIDQRREGGVKVGRKIRCLEV